MGYALINAKMDGNEAK